MATSEKAKMNNSIPLHRRLCGLHQSLIAVGNNENDIAIGLGIYEISIAELAELAKRCEESNAGLEPAREDG
jgi:hypothetical protein